jgi:hypothetical protein
MCGSNMGVVQMLQSRTALLKKKHVAAILNKDKTTSGGGWNRTRLKPAVDNFADILTKPQTLALK